MTTHSRFAKPVRTARRMAIPRLTVALLTAGLISACGDTDEEPPIKRDAARDISADKTPARLDGSDEPDSTGNKDQAPLVGCTENGVTYSPGQTVYRAGTCPQTCVCLANGLIGQCTGGCVPDASPPDTRPVTLPDAAIVCRRGTRTYAPGESVPATDGCGGSCVCLSNGTIGNCTGACGPEAGPERRDVAMDKADVTPPSDPMPPIDTACSNTSAPCSTAAGGKGLCSAGSCKACAGAADDSKCAAVYGAGTICADGECVAGTCHDSTVCTGSKVCDQTHTCSDCASDLQCQNDAIYGKSTICLSNGQCVAGNCHTSANCEGKKLCDGTTHLCSGCTTDTQCQSDAVYGSSTICVSSQCVTGTCTATANCKSMGRLCPATGTNKICAACTTDAQCRNDTAYGSGYICSDGQCVSGSCTTSANCTNGRRCNPVTHVCVACSTDTQCKNDTVYGANTICLSGACVTGDCHDISSECADGMLCGRSIPHVCSTCTTDAQCTADTNYGTGHLCAAGLCVEGDCEDSTDCSSGSKTNLVCGASTPHTCGACLNDPQCKNDTKYGANTMCVTTTGLTNKGQCISNTCTAGSVGSACSANSADICCTISTNNHRCVPGNCCSNSDCQGTNAFCLNNTCTACDAVGTNRNYLVDPVNGNDTTATGSGTFNGGATQASCRFRTIARALEVIGTPSATTTITIIGASGGTTALHMVQGTGDTAPVEELPLTVPNNVTITTQTGPIKMTVPNATTQHEAFRLIGSNAKLQPASTSTALTIEYANHTTSKPGVIVASGTATISNVTITGSGDDGIQVIGGTATISNNVHVTSCAKNGLLVSDSGTAEITASANPSTTFESNTLYGIQVSGTGVLNITGAAATGGSRTVVVQDNTLGNINFESTGTLSSINNVYSYASHGDGLRIVAGTTTRIRVRNSVFLANSYNGIRIVYPSGTSDSNQLTNIDLGASATSSGYGNNKLQDINTGHPNGGSGLCVELGTDLINYTSQVLKAYGNLFSEDNCNVASGGGAVGYSDSCTGQSDVGGIVDATGDEVTFQLGGCTNITKP